MTVHLQPQVEAELKRVARERGCDLQTIVAEAFEQYLAASSITDVTSEQIGQTQEAIMSEAAHNRTPRLAHHEQAKNFRKQIVVPRDQSRLACECNKLDPAFEQRVAEEEL